MLSMVIIEMVERWLKLSSNRFVAVIDDEYELVCLFKDMLSTIEGLEVYGFTSPSDAFEHIRLNVLNYDLVLSDFKMPEITGIELLTKIKELKPSVKALLMSAFDIQDDELFNEGKTRNIVNKFLQKPIKMDVLINEIQTQII